MRARCVVAFVVAFLGVGCASDSTNPGTLGISILGKASFGYVRGGNSGSYAATGIISAATFTSNRYTTTFAVGLQDTTSAGTSIISNVPSTSSVSDVLTITVNAHSAGTFTIGQGCVAGASTCTSLVFVLGLNPNTGAFTAACTLSSGVVSVATYSETNATGSFSGSGVCAGPTGVSADFTISNGTFDVPVIKGGPVAAPTQ